MNRSIVAKPKYTCNEARTSKESLDDLKTELEFNCEAINTLMDQLQNARSELDLKMAEDYGLYMLIRAIYRHHNSIKGIALNIIHRRAANKVDSINSASGCHQCGYWKQHQEMMFFCGTCGSPLYQ